MDWKKIKVLYDEKDEFVNINSDDFQISYANGYNCHGLQCQYEGDTEYHSKIQENLDEISRRVREIAKLVEFEEEN